MSDIFNISTSNNFVETLANKLLQDYQNAPLDLANVLIFLPNHRSCLSLAEAFVRLHGMQPSLLPQMRAIGDIKEDELILSGISAADTFTLVPPAIDSLERALIFIKLIMSRYQEFGLEKISLSQSCFLAQELGSLIDKVCLQELDWQKLQDLVPEEYATHWQETLKFLNIITSFWPEILKERGVIDAGERKNILIKKQCTLWQKNPPSQHIIVAGTTAVSPAMKLLVKIVLALPRGEVYLAGLDHWLDDKSWEKIDETHPQFEIKQLLDYLQIDRKQIKNICPPQNMDREKLISEIMRPASTSEQWRNLKGKITPSALSGLKIIETKDSRTEALTIAVLIRRTLETPEGTIALVTPDRTLARRVSSELERWNIKIDDSAGLPLMHTPWGIFMRLIIAATLPSAKRKDWLALFKNSFFAGGLDEISLSPFIHKLDKAVWRKNKASPEIEAFLAKIEDQTLELKNALSQKTILFSDLLKKHIATAEKLSKTNLETSILWQTEDGKEGALFLTDLLDKSEILGSIDPAEYLSLFEALMTGITVHKKQISHPRIKILGPMEARLNHYDEIILGGFNEGVWPTIPTADPWMSRPMKKEFGFEIPEKQIGVLGLDFSNLLGAKRVYLTRSNNASGTPTVKSRWLMRIETILEALEIPKNSLSEQDCLHWASLLDTPKEIKPITAPAPTPPVAKRPRKLSASAVEKLIRDPYSVFAEYILKLKPLEDLEPEAEIKDFGNVVHAVLEEFGRLYPAKYPENAEQIMSEIGSKAFASQNFSPEKQAFWLPKFNKMIKWLAQNEKEYRQTVKLIHPEIWGHYVFENAPAGPFEIYAKADRLDETLSGTINIIDYKTGRGRKKKEVTAGYAPQLPIEGIIAAEGGFDNLAAKPVENLMYWKLGTEIISFDATENNLLEKIKNQIAHLINIFDFESTPYLSRPNPKYCPDYSDYEHLARVKEWSIINEDEE